jgi:hypothetical protein
MLSVKSKKEIGSPDSDLLTDLFIAVKAQHKEDGTGCTPFDSAAKRRKMLTDRWAGTPIVARVAEDSPAHITKTGVYDEKPGIWGERTGLLIEFPETEGEVESVSPAYGGYIALTNGYCVSLPNRGEKRPLPMDKLRLEVEVSA